MVLAWRRTNRAPFILGISLMHMLIVTDLSTEKNQH